MVGGSLGGLTTACLLRDLGHDVTVFERSSRELEQRGAGIGFLRATWRYLHERAGVELGDISVETPYIRYLARDGKVSHEAHHPYLFSSWNTVYQRTLAAFDRERYRLGHEMVDFTTGADGSPVSATFANGEMFEGDLLVCADGIGSIARKRLQPHADRTYAGYIAWRGMVPESQLPTSIARDLGEAITYFVYEQSHILVYPIPNVDGSVRPGDRLVNFVWYRNYREGDELVDVLTDRDGVIRELSVPPGKVTAHHEAAVREHARTHLPPQLVDVVHAVDELFLQVVYDIDVDQMVFDRAVLLGDAAVVARPHAAAGTAKAADDAWMLAEALDANSTIDEALQQWGPTQLALGKDLLERTRRIGFRSQVENSWTPGDDEFIFGLHKPGD